MSGRDQEPPRPRSAEGDARHNCLPGPQLSAGCEDPPGTEAGTLALHLPVTPQISASLDLDHLILLFT